MEVPDMKVQEPIHQMEPDQLQLWSQHYLFQEQAEGLVAQRLAWKLHRLPKEKKNNRNEDICIVHFSGRRNDKSSIR